MPRAALGVVAAGVLATALAAQGPPSGQVAGGRAGGVPALRTGTGLILGRVVDGSSTRGVADAVVDLNSPGAQPQRVQTDAEGRFLFKDVPSGSLNLTVSKPGYVGGAVGQRVPRGPTRPIELAEGERVGDLTLRLWKYGVIAGTVTDDRGDPVAGVQVLLIERTMVEGRPQLTPSLRPATTDDRGVYRMSTVAPGNYLICVRSEMESGRALASVMTADLSAMTSIMMRAMASGGRLEELVGIDSTLKGHAPVFYPSVPVPSQATVISVKGGEERSGLDLRSKPVPLVRVAGFVTDQGQPVPQMPLRLLIADEPGHEFIIANASTAPDGGFAFLAVPAGRYLLRGTLVPRAAMERGRGAGVVLGQAPVLPTGATLSVAARLIAGEPDSLKLALDATRGTPWRGRVVFEGTGPPPAPESLGGFSVTIVNVDASPAEFIPALTGRVAADGTLTTVGIPPGRFRVRATGAAPWVAKSAMAGGHDLLDVPFDSLAQEPPDILVTFTDRPFGTLAGVVRNARGDADAEAIVFVFPADTRLRTDFSGTSRGLKAARTTKAGYYSIPGLPAGEYLVAVGTDEQVDGWRQPAVLDQLTPGAMRVDLRDGMNRTMDLRRGVSR